jgi:flagellar secretion chaperone FliS
MSFGLSQYHSQQVQSASPARVIVQFYDGALRFIRQAEQSLSVRDFAGKGTQLTRAHAVVSELRNNLDHTRAPELCAELDRLYVFVLDCITEANTKADPKPLTGACKVLEQLRSAWVQLADEPTGVRIIGGPGK